MFGTYKVKCVLRYFYVEHSNGIVHATNCPFKWALKEQLKSGKGQMRTDPSTRGHKGHRKQRTLFCVRMYDGKSL